MPTALLVMDMQNGIVERYLPEADAVTSTLSHVIAAARLASIQVIFVRVAFRDGAPEVSDRNRVFSVLVKDRDMSEYTDATQIHSTLEPRGTDIVVTKRRVSAFAGSDLEVVLRSRDVDKLVLTGIATSGVVLSTLRQAADLDYGITVLSDGCLDADPEVHRVLMEKVFPRQASVVSVAEWSSGLSSES
jgi:nicotinamidase-related amidase